MTSFRQIESNRRNALKSTGPSTAAGKERSRCNAVCHGLTAETVIGALEDAEDYKGFEAAITRHRRRMNKPVRLAGIVNRMLLAPRLPSLARTKIREYIEEKTAGHYGHSNARLRKFTERLLIEHLSDIPDCDCEETSGGLGSR
jgi:hypothetical protein